MTSPEEAVIQNTEFMLPSDVVCACLPAFLASSFAWLLHYWLLLL